MMCVYCEKEIRDGSSYCPYCGKTVISFCLCCSEAVSGDYIYCPKCGNKLDRKLTNMTYGDNESDLDEYEMGAAESIYPFDSFDFDELDEGEIEEDDTDDEDFIGTEFETIPFDDCNFISPLKPMLGDYNGERISFGDFELIDTAVGLSIFEYTGSSKDIVIPSEANGKKVIGIDSSAFYSNKTLESVEIPEGITQIGSHAFFHCENLKEVIIPQSVKKIGSNAFEGTGLIEITLPPELTAIEYRTFADCKALKSVTVLSDFNHVLDHIDCEAFRDCSSLSEIKDRHFEEYSTKYMNYGYRFGKNAICAKEIGHSAFENCTSLRSLNIDSLYGVVNVDAFIGCTSLEELAVYYAKTIKSCFSGGLQLRKLYISSNAPNNRTIIEKGAFSDCSFLESVTLDGVSVIGESAFAGCVLLENLDLITTPDLIEKKAFEYCMNLNSPLDLKDLKGIGDNAFYSCCSLENVELSDRFDRKYLLENVFGNTNLQFV